MWAIVAPLTIIWREQLPDAGGLLLIQCIIVVVACLMFWQPRTPGLNESSGRVAPPTWAHARAFVAFWRNRDGAIRLVLFSATSALLLARSLGHHVTMARHVQRAAGARPVRGGDLVHRRGAGLF